MYKISNTIHLVISLLIISCSTTLAQSLKLADVFADHMVLQRGKAIPVWGQASPKEKITVSFAGQTKATKADTDGRWKVTLDPLKASSTGREMFISGKNEVVFRDILVGEVWLCSGQSNMYQPMNGYNGQPTYGTFEALKKAHNVNLRLFFVGKKGVAQPQDSLLQYKSWQAATPENVLEYSAVAYYFGSQLQDILDVPVGMIHTSWGGSKVQAWMSKECISEYEDVNLEGKDLSKRTNQIPTLLYNAMINPLIPFSIRGALWYQGESNRWEPELYRTYFPSMVQDWRDRWNQGEFPFYYVQIAPYYYGGDADSLYNNPGNSAFIREAQQVCLDLIPNSGMAVTLDIGEQNSIHPAKKKEVADRLLYNALNKTYGMKEFKADGPVFDSLEEKNGSVVLKFKNAAKGLYAYDGLEGFEIAGDNRVFYPAEAKIINNKKQILVTSEKVANPVAVRYCWRNWTVGTLFDNYLLPVPSFRTDDWKDATRVADE